MGKFFEKTKHSSLHSQTQMWGLSDYGKIHVNLNIFRVSSKVSLTIAQSNMMICCLKLVWSVKDKITRLSVSPSGPVGFCFTAFTKRGKKQKRKGERDFTDGGVEPESEKKRQIVGNITSNKGHS